jgi:hypothetical protein
MVPRPPKDKDQIIEEGAHESDEDDDGEQEVERLPNRGEFYDIPKDVPGTPE